MRKGIVTLLVLTLLMTACNQENNLGYNDNKVIESHTTDKSNAILTCMVTVGFCLAQNPLMPSLWLRADSIGLGTNSWRDVSGNRIVFGLGHPIDDSQANRNILADGDFIIMGTDSCGMSVTSVLSLADGRTFETVGQSVVRVSGSRPSQYGTYLQVAETPSSASPQNHILKTFVPMRSRLRPNLIPIMYPKIEKNHLCEFFLSSPPQMKHSRVTNKPQ